MKEEVISFFTAPATYLALLCAIVVAYLLLKIFKKIIPTPAYASRIILSVVIVLVASVAYIVSYSFIGTLLN